MRGSWRACRGVKGRLWTLGSGHRGVGENPGDLGKSYLSWPRVSSAGPSATRLGGAQVEGATAREGASPS